jgi:ribosomal-protein-alanine N-acetyltransferase
MIEVGLMTLQDVDQVHEIEKQSFAIPWSRDAFIQEVTENRCARYLVARQDGVAVAYAGMWLVLDEAHVTNIAVRKDQRGAGFGEKVARTLMQLAADSGIRYMTLEVRRSNLVAQGLYKKLGFVEVGFRKRYYADNNEDALVMACEQMPEAHPENDPYLLSE